jgi:hypothetical protein
MKTKKYIRPPFPIDVVYTWAGEKSTNDPRNSFNNELKYSLRSVYHYAPWINNIYILMNTYKQPSWMKPNDKIFFVEIKDTFPSNEYLPNTNSNAIETTICNIPNLSEHYIYFCDDIFIGKPIKYTHFFTPDGKAKISTDALKTKKTLKHNSTMHIRFPPNNHLMYEHVPIPCIKSVALEFNNKYSGFIHWVRSTKNRMDDGFGLCEQNKLNAPCQQIHYPLAKYTYSKNKAILVKVKQNYVGGNNYIEALPDLATNKPFLFCINDDIPKKEYEKRKGFKEHTLKFYNEYFPHKAIFEL